MNERMADREPLPMPPAPRPGGEPFLSVIVPVRNEAHFIRDTLDRLLTQRYDPRRFEVLVADGGSTDGTRTVVAAYARRFPQVRLLDNPGRLSSAGRNAAIRSQGVLGGSSWWWMRGAATAAASGMWKSCQSVIT